MKKQTINKIKKRIEWLRSTGNDLEDIAKELKCFLDCLVVEIKTLEKEIK